MMFSLPIFSAHHLRADIRFLMVPGESSSASQRSTSFSMCLGFRLWAFCDYKTRDQARASLFDYLEVFYNRQRRHSTINYETPLAFESNDQPLSRVSTIRG